MRKLQGLTPVVATEIEFYLHGASTVFTSENDALQTIAALAESVSVPIYSVEKERGKEQFEVSLPFFSDVESVIANTECFKRALINSFAKKAIQADFSAKPLLNDHGSGLHIHVHLEDDKGKNVFFRQEDVFSPLLLHSVAGLLATMNASMVVFAPSEASYARFVAGSNAPTTVSWGPNNRTVAIRMPDKPLHNKHLEHRVAGSDADVRQVIEAILQGIDYGITHTLLPPEPIYGNAALPQYACPPLAGSLAQALAFHSAAQ